MQLEAIDLAAAVRFGAAGGETLGLCLFDESWHQGVVGLVAGRIKDRLHRPVIAFARCRGRHRCAARHARSPASTFAMRSTASPRATPD